MDYRTILIQTLKMLWKHKTIPGFGCLLVVIPAIFALLIFGALAVSAWFGFDDFSSVINKYMYIWIALSLVAVLLSIGGKAIGYAGILKGTLSVYDGAETVPFRELWAAGWPFAGRLAAVFLLFGFIISLITTLPALLGFLTAGVAFLCFLPFIFLIIPLSFMLQATMSLGMSAIVAGNLGVLAAIQRTWQVFRSNAWPQVLMALSMYLLQSVVGGLISSPLVIGLSLFMILWGRNDTSRASFVPFFGILAMLVLPLIFIIQGFVTTYIQSVWMLVHLRLTRPPQVKIEIQTGDMEVKYA